MHAASCGVVSQQQQQQLLLLLLLVVVVESPRRHRTMLYTCCNTIVGRNNVGTPMKTYHCDGEFLGETIGPPGVRSGPCTEEEALATWGI